MIDYDVVLNKFITVARTAVGDKLSLISAGVPSVIRVRQAGTKPNYPYIVVDVKGTTKTSGWLLYTGLDENDNQFYETNYKMTVRYHIFGGNAQSIAQELEGYFRLSGVLDSITTDTTGQLEATGAIISNPIKLSTEYIESAFFDVLYNIIDRYEVKPEENQGAIDHLTNNATFVSTQTVDDVITAP